MDWRTIGSICVVLLSAVMGSSAVHGQLPFAPPLPPANEFRLTLVEAPNAKLPPDPACGEDAAGTLTCRAFTVTLENTGTHIVQLGELDCADPEVRLESTAANPASWFPVGEHRDDCHNAQYTARGSFTWKNLRLKPGDLHSFTERFMVRMGGTWGPVDAPSPSIALLRATWTLRGCTEDITGDDCLSVLETHKVPPNILCSLLCIFFQPSLEVSSEPIKVSQPGPLTLQLPPLELRLIARMLDPSDSLIKPSSRLEGCTQARAGSIDCVAFHMTVRNAGTRALRIGRWTCGDFAEAPEFRTEGGAWRPLQSSWAGTCERTFVAWTALIPGQTIEEDMTLRHVAAGFWVNPMREAGRYDVRIQYSPNVCVASPDGGFCLTRPQSLLLMTSPVATFETTATLSEERSTP